MDAASFFVAAAVLASIRSTFRTAVEHADPRRTARA